LEKGKKKENRPVMIEKDLEDFLHAGKQLEYDAAKCEAGRVLLKKHDMLKVEEIVVSSEAHDDDPNAGSNGDYSVPVVDLSESSDKYNGGFLLVWIPDLALYGSYDTDHHVLTVFGKEVRWQNIVSSPAAFLEAQWYPERKAGRILKAWKHYKFRKRKTLKIDPLYNAIMKNKFEAIEKIITKDRSILDYTDDQRWTPLYTFLHFYHENDAQKIILKLFLENGAPVSARDSSGKPFVFNMFRNHSHALPRLGRIFALLTEQGLDINIRDGQGNTLLLSYINGLDLIAEDIMTRKRSDMSSKIDEAVTIVEMLRKLGLDVKAKNNDGDDVLSLTKRYGFVGINTKLGKII
jgi:hypothetical protein